MGAKTIYFPDGEHEKIQEIAKKADLSVSKLILKMFNNKGESQKPMGAQDRLSDIQERLGRVESKLDKILGGSNAKPAQPDKYESRKPNEPSLQDKLDEERSKKGSIKKAAIERSKDKISESDEDMLKKVQKASDKKKVEWSGGYSKDKQLGKKGKS